MKTQSPGQWLQQDQILFLSMTSSNAVTAGTWATFWILNLYYWPNIYPITSESQNSAKSICFPPSCICMIQTFPCRDLYRYSMCLYLEPWNQCFQMAEISLFMLMSINMELHFILPSLLINYILHKYKYITQKFNFSKIWYNVLNGRICIILKIRWNCSQSFKTFKPSL